MRIEMMAEKLQGSDRGSVCDSDHKAVETEHLFKSYRRSFDLGGIFKKRKKENVALQDVTLSVRCGEIFGLVGRNGSGKTSLLKIIATLIHPTAGSLRVLGYDPMRNEQTVRQNVGFVPSDERSFFWRLTCMENLLFFGGLYGLSKKSILSRLDQLCEELDIRAHFQDRFDSLSSGQKQLISIIRSLLLDPHLLIVDEPTRSLDIETALIVRQFLKKQVEEKGKTVLIASHLLDDIETLCHRFALLDKGILVAIHDRSTMKQGETFSEKIVDEFHNLGVIKS